MIKRTESLKVINNSHDGTLTVKHKGSLTTCHSPSMSLWLMASMETDLVRGRVMGGQVFRRGRYRLDFWSTRQKVESNTVHENVKKKDSKPSRHNVEQNITSH